MARREDSGEMRLLLDLIDEAYDRHSWHGTNLRGSLRGIDETAASWRPAEGRHNIWEIAVHAAYWKYNAWRRLAGQERGTFPLKGSNWFTRPDPDRSRAWREDVALLTSMHAQLREVVAALSAQTVGGQVKGTLTVAGLVRGVAAHDLYHAGQIQLLKRLMTR